MAVVGENIEALCCRERVECAEAPKRRDREQ